MTYVTGQPILFVGCGQVCINACAFLVFLTFFADLHGPQTIEGSKRGASDSE